MAHTDRHRPYRVQLADPEERGFYWFQAWPGQHEKVFTFRTCSCRWHSMYYPRKAEARTRRRLEREAALDVINGNADAFEAVTI